MMTPRAQRRLYAALIIIFPLRKQCAPLVGDGDRLPIGRHSHVHDRSVANHRAALISYFLPHDEAGVSDGRETSADAEIIAWMRLRLVRCFDLSHHRPKTRSHVLFVRHVALERRPARALEQCEHVRVIYVPDGIAIAWIDVNLEVFHRGTVASVAISDES